MSHIAKLSIEQRIKLLEGLIQLEDVRSKKPNPVTMMTPATIAMVRQLIEWLKTEQRSDAGSDGLLVKLFRAAGPVAAPDDLYGDSVLECFAEDIIDIFNGEIHKEYFNRMRTILKEEVGMEL